jgi:hypothetical protein
MLEMSNVMTAFAGLLIGCDRVGRHGDGERQYCAHKRKPCHHHSLRVRRTGLGDCCLNIEVGADVPRAMTLIRLELLLSAQEWLATLYPK